MSENRDPLQPISDYTLSPEQLEGVRFQLSRPSSIIAAQTGLGKTFIAAASLHHILHRYPTSRVWITCPAEANKAWKTWLSRVGISHRTYTATERGGPTGARVSLFNFSSMGKFERVFEAEKDHPVVMVIDESHVLQHRTSQQFRRLLSARQKARIVMQLSATPLMSVSHMRGLYNMVDFGSPGALGTWTSFRDEFLRHDFESFQVRGRSIKKERILGIRNPSELRARLAKHVLSLALDYDIRYSYHKTSLEPGEWVSYRKAGRGILEDSATESFAHRLHDLQRLVDNSHDISDPSPIVLSSKERLFLDVLRERVLSRGFSTIVYAEYLSTVDRLESVLTHQRDHCGLPVTNILKVTGQVSRKSRDAAEDKLIPGTVLLCSKAGSQSRNFQRTNQIIFYNISFSIGRHLQICLTGKSRILTPEGYTKLFDAPQSGEVWTGFNWAPYKIRGTKKSPIVRVKFELSGISVDMSPDHYMKGLGGEWVRALDMVVGQHVARPLYFPSGFSQQEDITSPDYGVWVGIRETDAFSKRELYLHDRVESVTHFPDDPPQDVYTISVADPLHQYVADGFVHKNCGRISRMDTQFAFQEMHVVESEGTIDTYKRKLLQASSGEIESLFGENANLPDVQNIDRKFMKDLRRELLWSFRQFSPNFATDADSAQDRGGGE